MKAVQIGILASLLLVAGLLYNVYKGQQAVQPASALADQTQTAAPAAAPAVETPAEPTTAPEAVAQEPVPPQRPARSERRPSALKPKTEGNRMAANRSSSEPAAPPAAPAPQPAAQPAPTAPAAPANPGLLGSAIESPLPVPAPRLPRHVTIPAGTTITVRLAETLSSEKNVSGDSFSATLDQPLIIDGLAIAERGAKVEGKIAEADRAGRVRGVSSLSLQLVRLQSSDGQSVPINTEAFAKQGASSRGSDAKKIGVGAAIGAAIGAIAGGGRGAAIGAGVGGAAGTGTVMATRGKAAELPVETRLTFRIQEPVSVTEKIR